jgi:hypothetical protein
LEGQAFSRTHARFPALGCSHELTALSYEKSIPLLDLKQNKF